MEIILDFFQQLVDPNWIMEQGGLYLVLLILLIETGLFFGFFLPGDPLLFVSGMIIANAKEIGSPFSHTFSNLVFWELFFIAAAILGNMLGYWTGYKFSGFLKGKSGRRFLKPKHLNAAENFYNDKGGVSILIARFLPVVRTFVPIVAGIVKMNFRQFMVYNISGAILWVVSLTSLGYILGENQWVEDHLGWAVLLIVFVASLPVAIKYLKHRFSRQ